jgi:arginase
LETISLIAVPYELGRLRDGVGRGPEALLASGAVEALEASGATVKTDTIELSESFSSEVQLCFELIRRVRARVAAARAEGAFPVVLSGSCCFAALGVVAGLDESAPGVVWFDAHGDFNTPETTTHGYFDGMGLAVLVGDVWQGMLGTVPGGGKGVQGGVVVVGARDFDDDEEVRLRESDVRQVTPQELASSDALSDALGSLEPEPTALYLHVDLDVLDREAANVNIYGASGGITPEQLSGRVEDVLRTGLVRAMALTAYDPECDRERRVPPVASGLLGAVAGRAPA